jgi:hypothetical protein
MNDDFKLGFVMGIISGEGSFTGDYRKPALQVKMHARDITLLEAHTPTATGTTVCGYCGARSCGRQPRYSSATCPSVTSASNSWNGCATTTKT